MTSRVGVAVDGNPTSHPATGLNPGDLVLDYTGAVQGLAYIGRTNPTTPVRVQLATQADIVGADVVTVSESSSGAGELVLEFLVVNWLGVPRTGIPCEVVMGGNNPLDTVEVVSGGGGYVVGLLQRRFVKGLTDGDGLLNVRVLASATTVVEFVANSISVSPGSMFGDAEVP